LPMGEGNTLRSRRLLVRILECTDFPLMLQQESQLIDATQQTVPRERLEFEAETAAVGQFDESVFDVDREFDAGMLQQVLMLALAHHDGEYSVLQGIAAKNIGDLARQNGADAKIEQGPRRVLTRRPAAEIASGDEDLATLCLRLVQGEVGIGAAIGSIAPIVEQRLAQTSAFSRRQKARRNNAVRVDVLVRQHDRAGTNVGNGFHAAASCTNAEGSAMCPAIADAAATSGLANTVRTPGP